MSEKLIRSMENAIDYLSTLTPDKIRRDPELRERILSLNATVVELRRRIDAYQAESLATKEATS